jgi:uncharacterized membrane protein
MQPETKSKAPRPRWLELDLLRTLAVLLMILNHAAVGGREDRGGRLLDTMNFVGSFAPVLFFFLTGLGNGVQSVGKLPGPRSQDLIKIGVLLAADAFLWIHPGRWVGMDFLGFIAISAVLLKELQRLPRSGSAAVALALAVFGVRFAAGPMLRAGLPDSPGGRLAGTLLGIEGTRGFSYPLAPWLFYPLIGYALGRFAARRRSWIEARRFLAVGIVGVAAIGFAAVATALALRGAEVFRWGTMSFAFFVAGLAAIGVSVAAVLAGGARASLAALSTGAQQSFAVVPLHYTLLAVASATLGPIQGPGTYWRNTLLVVALSFAGAALVARASAALKSGGRGVVNGGWALVIAACLAGGVVLATIDVPQPASTAIRAAGQLGLCILLGLPLPARARPSPTRRPEPEHQHDREPEPARSA